MRRRLILLLALAASCSAVAQNESRVHSDFRREFEALQSCGKFNFGAIADCGQTAVTGQPLHMAFGAIAPQNGTGFGLALVEHTDFQSRWRTNYNFDAVGSSNGSWRAGAFLKAYRQPGGVPVVIHPGNAAPEKTAPLFNIAPLFEFYSETTSLNTVYFWGLGNQTLPANRTTFGFEETVLGTKATVPFAGRAGIGLIAEFNGRFPSLRVGDPATVPSTGSVFNETTAPGITHQQAFFQAGQGLRIKPSIPGDYVLLDYLVQFQQFIASSSAQTNFRRWTVDLNHEIPLYRKVRLTSVNEHNGPDSCATGSGVTSPRPCPHVSLTQNLEGSISARLLISESFAKAGSAVPFYFMPTLGGSDINGQPLLASYPDYRFRGPDVLLLHGGIEHSIGKLPIGALFSFDEGKVATQRNGIAFDHLRHTFTTGVTVHAGGLPVIDLFFAWGGHEGHHGSAVISNALLGGSPRPSLF